MSRPRREGFALMAALWLIVLVGITGYELSVRSRARRLAVANALEAAQAVVAAEAGVETAQAALEFRLAHPLDTRAGRAAEAVLDPWGDLSDIVPDTIRLGEGRALVSVRDAGSMVHVNRASEDGLRRLLVALPLDASIADRLAQRILDWRDADDLRRARGAEREDYVRAAARVLPANADFNTIEELREVDGMTAEIWSRLAPLVTVRGSGQVNVNSAPRAVLQSLPGFGPEAIDVVLHARDSGHPIRSMEALSARLSPGARNTLVDAAAAATTPVAFETREVHVSSRGWLNGSSVRSYADASFERSGDAALPTWRRVTR